MGCPDESWFRTLAQLSSVPYGWRLDQEAAPVTPVHAAPIVQRMLGRKPPPQVPLKAGKVAPCLKTAMLVSFCLDLCYLCLALDTCHFGPDWCTTSYSSGIWMEEYQPIASIEASGHLVMISYKAC